MTDIESEVTAAEQIKIMMTEAVCFKKFIAHRSGYSVTVYIHPYRKKTFIMSNLQLL